MERLTWEMKKDQEQTDLHKQRMIEEIKSYDKSKMFVQRDQKKLSLFKKFLLTLGYGKKR
jgi:hypothetical protein